VNVCAKIGVVGSPTDALRTIVAPRGAKGKRGMYLRQEIITR